MEQKPKLKFENITKTFGGITALSDVDLEVDAGKIVGLIGPNGAGKSTLFNIAMSLYKPDKGEVYFDGAKITGIPSQRISRMGVSRTFQLVKTFLNMTALNNVLVGAIFSGGLKDEEAYEEANQALKLVGLDKKAHIHTSKMGLSDRRLLEIARALASRSQVTLLDEPLAGLNPTETNTMLKVIDTVRNRRGTAILWVEHKVSAIFSLCDSVAVLDYGRIIAFGKPEEISSNSKVIEAYLGKKNN